MNMPSIPMPDLVAFNNRIHARLDPWREKRWLRWLFYLGFASIAGTFLGGYFGDKLGKRDPRWYLWLPGLATLISVPFSAFVYLYHAPYTALWVLSVSYFLGAYYLGPTFSLTQGLVGLRMRALAASILLFILNIIQKLV